MQNDQLVQAGRGADLHTGYAAPALPFRILDFRRCAFGSKVAEFRIEIEGLGLINAELFIPQGRRPFACGASIRSKYNGAYQRTIRFEDEFADDVCSAAMAHFRSADETVA